MTTIKPLLDQMTGEVQSKVKRALSGLLSGALVRGYLPQSWVFETESEIITFHVDSNGNARTLVGASGQRDITVRGPGSDLSIVLGNHQIPPGAEQRIKIIHHTEKGRTAWNYLKGRFGF